MSTATHCLDLQEICTAILQHSYGDGDDIDTRRAVGAFGLTCKSYHRIAEPILWSHLRRVSTLVKCFPPDVWEMATAELSEDEYDDGGWNDTPLSIMTFTRTPSHDDWIPVLRKAELVVALTNLRKDAFGSAIDVDAWRILSSSKPVQTLFPNLRTLEWGHHDPRIAQYGHILLGPKLTSLHLVRQTFDRATEYILSACSLSPALASISVAKNFWKDGADSVDRQARPELDAALVRLHHLKVYDVPMLMQPAVLQRFASFSSLRVLTAVMNDSTTSFDESVQFPALRELRLRTPRLTTSTEAILRVISSSQLHTIDVESDAEPSGSILRAHMQSLADSPSCLALKNISFKYAEAPNFPGTFAFDVIRPLLALRGVTELRIHPGHLQLNDGAMEELSESLPELAVLELLPVRWTEHIPLITLYGLAPLLQRCPHLRTLGLLVDARIHKHGAAAPELSPRSGQSSLRCLNVAHSPIDAADPPAVARFLSAYCAAGSLRIKHGTVERENEAAANLREHRARRKRWRETEKLLLALKREPA